MDPIPAFEVNTEPDPRSFSDIGFSLPKRKKFLFSHKFFLSQIAIKTLIKGLSGSSKGHLAFH